MNRVAGYITLGLLYVAGTLAVWVALTPTVQR